MACTIDFPPDLAKQVTICAAACGVSGQQFITAAVKAAVMTCAQHDLSLATMLRVHAVEREVVPA